MDPWVVEVLKEGYCLPFLSVPQLSLEPIPMPSYSPQSIKGTALAEVTLSLVEKGAVEITPLPSPGFYSRLFVVWKTSGSWRPVIDLSMLNHSLSKTPFKMETLASVLLSVRQGDWMVSLDLKKAYLQVPIHSESHKFLRFVAFGRVYQFNGLCFGLSTAPQVFTRVMAPVSVILHSLGIRLRRYLDDWLIQASSREAVLQSLEVVISFCLELDSVINPDKVQLCSGSACPVSGDYSGLCVFQGFTIPSESREAAINCRIIPLLQAAARFYLAGSSGCSLLPLSSDSRRSPSHEVSPAHASSLLGQGGRFGTGAMGLVLSSGSVLVARPGPYSPR